MPGSVPAATRATDDQTIRAGPIELASPTAQFIAMTSSEVPTAWCSSVLLRSSCWKPADPSSALDQRCRPLESYNAIRYRPAKGSAKDKRASEARGFGSSRRPNGDIAAVTTEAGPSTSATAASRSGRGPISFTGSNAVGQRLYAQASAKRLCRVQLELGGKNPVVVLEDADLEKAANDVVLGAYGSSGQRCTATSRAVVVLHIDSVRPLPICRPAARHSGYATMSRRSVT